MEWHSIISGLVGGATATALSIIALRTMRGPTLSGDGWSTLRPGWMMHLALFGSAGFSLLMAWLYLFVGSARADAEMQELYMLILAGAFGLAAVLTWWFAYARVISWKGMTLRVGRFGRHREYDLTGIEALEFIDWRHEYRLTLADGRTIHLSPYMHGAEELAEHISGL